MLDLTKPVYLDGEEVRLLEVEWRADGIRVTVEAGEWRKQIPAECLTNTPPKPKKKPTYKELLECFSCKGSYGWKHKYPETFNRLHTYMYPAYAEEVVKAILETGRDESAEVERLKEELKSHEHLIDIVGREYTGVDKPEIERLNNIIKVIAQNHAITSHMNITAEEVIAVAEEQVEEAGNE